MKTVNDMYNYAHNNNKKLLSDYPAEFWEDYLEHSSRYDKLFRRMFLSFKYFLQYEGASVGEITDEFIDEVYNHLMLNDKKYSELFRVNVVSDTDYSILDNYNVTEVMDKDASKDDMVTLGQRTDTTTTDTGAQTSTQTNKVSPFDSENFYGDNSSSLDNGARHDTVTAVKGLEEDSSNSQYEENYTLTKKGNIGIQTATDIMGKHKQFWTMWQFYEYIFKDIASELLII